MLWIATEISLPWMMWTISIFFGTHDIRALYIRVQFWYAWKRKTTVNQMLYWFYMFRYFSLYTAEEQLGSMLAFHSVNIFVARFHGIIEYESEDCCCFDTFYRRYGTQTGVFFAWDLYGRFLRARSPLPMSWMLYHSFDTRTISAPYYSRLYEFGLCAPSMLPASKIWSKLNHKNYHKTINWPINELTFVGSDHTNFCFDFLVFDGFYHVVSAAEQK